MDVVASSDGLMRPLMGASNKIFFRDFETSKIVALQEAVAKAPAWYSTVYFVAMVLWSDMLSYGSALQPRAEFAHAMTPHVSLIFLVVGMLIYPKRWLWVPIAGFALVFPIAFIVGSHLRGPWYESDFVTPRFIATYFALHLVFGAAAGLASRWASERLHEILSPYHADLLSCLGVAALFVLMMTPVAVLLAQYAGGLPEATREAMGFGKRFGHEVGVNILRNAAEAVGILLCAMSRPSRKQFLAGIGFALIFVVLGLTELQGFGTTAEMDLCLMALFLVFSLPIPVALTACVAGFPVFASITGAFLDHKIALLPQDRWIEAYSVLTLMLTVYIVILRDLTLHSTQDRAASMRRLNRARDFANVGLLSFSLVQGRYRADVATARILGVKQEGSVADFIVQFHSDQAREVHAALNPLNEGSVNLQLQRTDPNNGNKPQFLRFFLWYESAPNKEKVAYGLVLDTTREHEQAVALQETLAELKTRQERQRQLFSIVSHELRTPAAVISMLLDELDHPDQIPMARQKLRDVTDQLLSTLADMRQAVNPTENLPVRRVPYAASELVESIRNMLEPQAAAAGIKIRIVLGPDAHRLRVGDAVRVRQAITNLVRNAILHSKGTDIRIMFHAARSGDGKTPVSVWKVIDNGIGIPEGEVERMFQPFERGGDDPRKQADGSGLGLFIAKSSIETLGGRLVHFTPLAGGSGWLLELPEPLASSADLSAASRRDGRAVPESFPSLYVLLAEDNKLVADVTRAQLSRFIGRVDVVENGNEALRSIAANKPDILITDLFMPEMDGDELVRSLRARGDSLPVIGLTAAVVGDDIDRFRSVGVETVMSKPIDVAMLRQNILDFLCPN